VRHYVFWRLFSQDC